MQDSPAYNISQEHLLSSGFCATELQTNYWVYFASVTTQQARTNKGPYYGAFVEK